MQEKRIRLQDALYGRSPRLLRVHQARQWIESELILSGGPEERL
jgi:hypothetical protein